MLLDVILFITCLYTRTFKYLLFILNSKYWNRESIILLSFLIFSGGLWIKLFSIRNYKILNISDIFVFKVYNNFEKNHKI